MADPISGATFEDLKEPQTTTKAKTSPRKSAPAKRGRKPTVDIQSGMTDLYTAIGLGLSVAFRKDGELLVSEADKFGEAWSRAADRSPKIKARLESLLVGSAFAELVVLHAGLAMKIASNHGVIPEGAARIFDGEHANGNGTNGVDLSSFDPGSLSADQVQTVFPHLDIKAKE